MNILLYILFFFSFSSFSLAKDKTFHIRIQSESDPTLSGKYLTPLYQGPGRYFSYVTDSPQGIFYTDGVNIKYDYGSPNGPSTFYVEIDYFPGMIRIDNNGDPTYGGFSFQNHQLLFNETEYLWMACTNYPSQSYISYIYEEPILIFYSPWGIGHDYCKSVTLIREHAKNCSN